MDHTIEIGNILEAIGGILNPEQEQINNNNEPNEDINEGELREANQYYYSWFKKRRNE